jgi:MOSC domain-containing protein YiiM
MPTSPPIAVSVPIRSIQCGEVQDFRGFEEPSAIAKQPVTGPVRVHRLGLDGDAQADLTVHGGPDKAIHHYPHDHYAFWRESLGDHPLLADYGAFGENIATDGLTEEAICIGDRWRLGTALVEVSQGRQPCFDAILILDRIEADIPIAIDQSCEQRTAGRQAREAIRAQPCLRQPRGDLQILGMTDQ